MTYAEYRNKRQTECNALPVFFAFSDEQFEKHLAERGLKTTPEDLKKLCQFGNGGFYLKSDSDKIRNFIESDNLDELMKDPEFAEDAFYYEMGNHEYAINWQGDWDVCSCFCNCKYDDNKSGTDYLRENGYAEEIINAYISARKRHMNDAKDW